MSQNWLNVGLQPSDAAFYQGRPVSLDDPDVYGSPPPRVEGMNLLNCIQTIIQVVFRTSGTVIHQQAASDGNNEVYLVTLRRAKDSPIPHQVQFRAATENKILSGLSIDSEVRFLFAGENSCECSQGLCLLHKWQPVWSFVCLR